ncbi:hypothetical protein [Saccharicrinis aurantiacus]|uniref:hypothetical protein n=1 Tax=Saccharicrinis aurantiacus TaxID=1849719 RepID=UPI00248F9949|nr:hypothetical protein [Saccharicrinis aurantiacus]
MIKPNFLGKVREVILISIFLLVSVNTFAETWYTLASGDWDDPTIWTLDPAGAVSVNPGNTYPQLTSDNIVILSGKTITMPDGNDEYNAANNGGTARNISVTCGVLTVDGRLDFRSTEQSTFTTIRGGGKILLGKNNFPIGDRVHFITKGQGEGTVVYYNDYPWPSDEEFFNVEVDFIDLTGDRRLTINKELTVNGNLTVKSGKVVIGGNNGLAKVKIYGDLVVEAGGQLVTANDPGASGYHTLELYGDFINNGTVNFTDGAQYSEPANSAVKLNFLGSTDNQLICNGTTNLYRIFVNKGGDKTFGVTISANNINNFKLFGPVTGSTSDNADGSKGYERLPLVIENGTLQLGDNIKIDRLGENINGSEPKEFTIPETGRLWINGADVITSKALGSATDHTGISILGELKVSSGTLTTPKNSSGLTYRETTGVTSRVVVEGGNVYTTALKRRDGDTPIAYVQSGGIVDFFEPSAFYNDWGGDGANAVFSLLDADDTFAMLGGEMIFRYANSDHVTGIFINSDAGNYNVTGGTVKVAMETTSRDFYIHSSAPFYNFIVAGGTSSQGVYVTHAQGGEHSDSWPGGQTIINDFTIESGALFGDKKCPIEIGGAFNVAGTYNQTGSLLFNGAQDGAINNITGSILSLPGLYIYKDKHPADGQYYTVAMGGDDNVNIVGALSVQRGAFDPVDYWPTVTGGIVISDGDLTSSGNGGLELTGSSPTLQGKFGKEFNFGNIRLGVNVSTLSLATDVNVANFDFYNGGTGKVSLGTYNLTVTGDISNATSARYFYTDGNASDGGLTLEFDVPTTAKTIASYHVGTSSSDYSTVVVKSFAGQSVSTNGLFTVIPVNNTHPSTDPNEKGSVLAYYWKTKASGFDGLEDSHVQLEFTSSKSVKNLSPAFLDNYEWSVGKKLNGGTTLTYDYTTNNFAYVKLIDSDYTAATDNGNGQIPIGAVKVYRSTGDHTWASSSWEYYNGTNWVSGTPGAYDIAIVQAGHTVTIDTNNEAASQVEINGTLFVSSTYYQDEWNPFVPIDNVDIGIVKGSGRLVYENTVDYGPNNIIKGDHRELSDTPGATIEFTGIGNYTLPAASQVAYYPSLTISGSGIKSTPSNGDVLVLGDLYVDDAQFNITNIYNGELNIAGNLKVNTGTLSLSVESTHHTYVGGDIEFTGMGTIEGGGAENNIYLEGNIITVNGSKLDFSSNKKANVVFQGNNSVRISGAGTIDFYRVYTDKPAAEKVEFTAGFSLNGPANDATKSLVLQSGECHLNNSSIDLELNNSGAYDFPIPAGATLRVDNGAKVSTSSTNSGIELDGSLYLENGAQLATIRHIEYSASGNALLSVSSGAILNVGSQLRRNATSDNGILSFVQNGGIVNIGTQSAGVNSRGMFEIMGAGSSFSQTSDDIITISNNNGSTSVPSIYYHPETVNVAAGSGFVIDASGEFGINANQPINSIELAAESNAIAKLYTSALTLEESLIIGTNSTFDANDLYLYVEGDITNNGTFAPGTGAVFMTGEGDQTISGTATSTLFYDLTKISGTGELGMETEGVEVNRFLTLEDGSINTNTNTIIAKGDVVNNGHFVTENGDGLVMGGSELQGIQGRGNIDVLTIDNAAGVNLPTQSSAFAIGKKLKLTNGIFDIGRNLLVINDEAIIVDASDGLTGFSAGNMVQTNLSFTDAGIKKFFPSSFLGEFVYPIGSFGKYTPVNLDVSANTANDGSIRVKAANEAHVSVLDPTRVLQYNWTLDADQVSGLSADVVMQYENADALGDESKYINAKLLLTSDEWNKSDGSIDITNDQIKYSWTGADELVIDGDYTAGEPDAIPDVLPSYITMKGGSNWGDESVWATYDPVTGDKGAAGVMIPAGGPSGAIVYIEHDITLPATPSKVAYRTYIEGTGIIDVGSTHGHRLGTVSGTGTIKITDGGVLPAGTYDAFIDAIGGTVEYYGSSDYDVMSELPVFNNVIFSGSGKRRLPNNDVVVGGALTIDGATLSNEYNEVLYIAGDLNLINGGVFEANQGTTSFVGSTTQNIDSEFSASNAFYNFEIDNLKGVNVNSNIEIKNKLKLKNGIIDIANGSTLTLSSHSSDIITGGSNDSYVSGKVRKYIVSGSSFVYPLGDGYRYGYIKVLPQGGSLGYWDAQYYSQGKDHTIISDDVKFVSNSEHWQLSAPYEGALAKVTFRWDALSGVDASDVQIVNWADNTGSGNVREEWDVLPVSNITGDNNSGTVELQNYLEFGYKAGEAYHYFTFGSESEPPAFSWTGDIDTDWFKAGNWSTFEVPHSGSDVTITNTTNKPVVSALGHVYCNNIEIQKDASLTIQAGARVDILGSVSCTDAEQLTIQNTTDLPSSVIIGGGVNQDIKSEWTYVEELRYWYIGQAINGATVSDYGTQGTDVLLLNYPGSWRELGDNEALVGKLEGYSVMFKDPSTKVEVTGSINKGELTSSLSEGWHLIGNPYLSYLDVNREAAWDFDNDKIDQTVWIRTDLASVRGFATYNISEGVGANGGSNEIAPGQSFWLNANYAANFKLNEAAQIHGANTRGEGGLKSVSTEEREEVFRFTIGDGVYTDEVIAVFRPYGSTVLTSRDSKKRFVSNADFPQVYAMKSSTKVVINIASSLSDEQSIPIGINVPESKKYVFKANSLNTFLPTYDISLEDKLMGEYYDIRINPELEIEMDKGTSNDRFVLHFAQRSTDLDEQIIAKKPTIYAANGMAYINIDPEQFNNNTGGCFVEVYDFAGKKHIIQNLYAAQTQLELPESNKLWIIVVRIGNKSYHEKVSSSK